MKICPTCQKTYPDDFSLCPRDGAQLTAPATETEAQLAAGLSRRFRIVRRLGKGGMGTVFLAEQIGVGNRPVALKVLNRKLLDDPDFLMRFQNEAGSTGRIHHPNVVTIYESAQSDDGTPYIAMEFLEGESLREVLRQQGAIPLPEVAEILQQAAGGLNAAHKLGIIHRDLKPDNLFLTHGDQGELIVKVVDFGIAKLRESPTHTMTGTVLGTPAYMSYEQASGMRSDELDARSDVYSLGVVVYEMLTGRTPFHSDTPVGYLRMHMQEDPPPFRTVKPDLPALPQLESVVMKALTKDRNQRHTSVLEFAQKFAQAAEGVSHGAAQPEPQREAAKPQPQTTVTPVPNTIVRAAVRDTRAMKPVPERPHPLRRKWLVIGSVVFMLAIATMGLFLYMSHRHHPDFTRSNKTTLADAYHVTAFRDGAYIIEHKGHRLTAKCRESLLWPQGPEKPENDHDCLYMSNTVGKSIGDDLMMQAQNALTYSPEGASFSSPEDILDITNDEPIRTGSELGPAQEQKEVGATPGVDDLNKFSTLVEGPFPKPGMISVNPKDNLKYIWIPPGTFMMGCSPGDSECGYDETPLHQVTITKGLWMGQTEVTVAAYKRFAGSWGRQMPSAPSFNNGWASEDMPIVNVSWFDAQAYCGWAAGRLPTEAEWEYAARGGSTEGRYGSIDEIAWYRDNSGGQAHDVAEKRPNGLGLYDILGNVWEWVSDWYDEHYYQSSPSQNPPGPASGQHRVLRGGALNEGTMDIRVSRRLMNPPSFYGNTMGFRCGREVNP